MRQPSVSSFLSVLRAEPNGEERPADARKCAWMARRVLPAALALAALAGDLSGHHVFALVALLGAIPAAFALTLECYGDALEARCGGVRPLIAGAGMLSLLLSAALRSPAVVGGVPQLAVSAIVFCLLLYAGQALAFLLALEAPTGSARTGHGEQPTAEVESFADAA
jgi:hypothetical protein